MSAAASKRLSGRAAKTLRARRNSAAAARQLAESWSGRAPRKVVAIDEALKHRKDLADLGGLEELEVFDPANDKYVIPIRFGHDVRVAGYVEEKDGKPRVTQIYFVGGEQAIDDLEPFGVSGSHDKEVLGLVAAITYNTAKHHLGKADKIAGPYRHEFAEEGGEYPTLIYDTLNRRIELAGGSYFIDLGDYDGKHSAGVRD